MQLVGNNDRCSLHPPEDAEMDGPFQLANSVIDTVINNTDPAVFLLRRIEETPEYAHYRALIGRTDGNLAKTLKQWLDSDYRVFSFQYVESTDAAFKQQCMMWHQLEGPDGKLDNERHPEPNDGQVIRCPVCST
ncbi:hypothetical protein C6502_18100 [Candidatus Poribacteria bacterium]|nr:MAG: hypothetical protein C6502_18100 [Candidatus Poribacteria bacterium]